MILLDPGHGGIKDGKYVTAPSKMYDHGDFVFYEGVFNRQLANKIAKELDKEGIEYQFIVDSEDDVSLSERVRKANSVDGENIYLSIHGNAAGVESAKGIEVWTSRGQTESDIVSVCIYDALKDAGWNMRNDYSDGDPDKESDFYVLKHTSMPAVLVEYGFFTNREEALRMLDEEVQLELARLTVKGIKKYLS